MAPAWAALTEQPWVPSGVMVTCASWRALGGRSLFSSSGSNAMPIFLAEWLGTQKRWNPKVAIKFGVAARYRRAAVGSSHDDAHSDSPTLHTGTVRPTPALWRVSFFFISLRTWAMAVRKCSKCYQLFRKFHGRAFFVRWMMYPCLSMGPSRQRKSISALSRRAGSSGILCYILFLVKLILHRHRTGFEPQRWLTGT